MRKSTNVTPEGTKKRIGTTPGGRPYESYHKPTGERLTHIEHGTKKALIVHAKVTSPGGKSKKFKTTFDNYDSKITDHRAVKKGPMRKKR